MLSGDTKKAGVLSFAERLLPDLNQAFDQAEEGAEFIINLSQDSGLRTQLLKNIRRAGVKPCLNLRSTRETQLVETFPVHVTAAC